MYVTTFIGLPIAPHILNPKCGPPKRIISQFSWRFGWEFVDLHTLLPMFGKFQVHNWSWCRGLIEEHSIMLY